MARLQTYKENARNNKERIDIRLPENEKKLIQQAADILGRSMSEYVRSSAILAAQEVIDKSQDDALIRLSMADSLAFVKTLIKPKAPNKELKKAAKLHRKILKNK